MKLNKFLKMIFILASVSLTQLVWSKENCGNVNGVSIPCWRTYLRMNESDESLPYYPYAKRANGCSFLNQRPGESDILYVKNDSYNFRDACNIHDQCYYTLNSDEHECNKLFLSAMNQTCNQSGSDDTRMWCYNRAKIFYEAVEASSAVVHRYSQFLESLYLERVQKYLSHKH